MEQAMYRGLIEEQHHSLVRDVCPARLAKDGYILESPDAEELFEWA